MCFAVLASVDFVAVEVDVVGETHCGCGEGRLLRTRCLPMVGFAAQAGVLQVGSSLKHWSGRDERNKYYPLRLVVRC